MSDFAPQSKSPNHFYGIVRGRVQGVGYRLFARDAARRHGVRGWTRNLPDGTVEVHAEGEELSLIEFLTELYRGPVLAHVAVIDLRWGHVSHSHESFEILR